MTTLLLVSLKPYLINYSFLSLSTGSLCLVYKANQVSLTLKKNLSWLPKSSLCFPSLPSFLRTLCPPQFCVLTSLSLFSLSSSVFFPYHFTEKDFPGALVSSTCPHSTQPPWRNFITDHHPPQSFSFPWEWNSVLSCLFLLISFSNFLSFLYPSSALISSSFRCYIIRRGLSWT